MGRLSGFRYRDVARRLTTLGCRQSRQAAGSHEMWLNPANQRVFVVARHVKEIPEGTLRSILRQADLDVEAFLKA